MDVLNKTFARLGDWYRSLTPGARIAAGLLLAVFVASVAFLFNQQYAGGETYLFGGEPVTASQWPAMLQAFASAGLADYEMEDNRIRVPHGKQAVYLGALANAGALPNNFGDSLRKMLDKSSSPWIGKRQQEEMSKIALQDELTKIINSMPGIESASVFYNVEMEQGLHTRKQITASVNVKPTGNQLLTVRQVDMIRHVVGPPIGIDPQCVAIVDFNGATYPASTAGAASGSDRNAKAKLDYEQKYADRIREALGFIAGAVVTVNVELHPEPVATDNATRNDVGAAASGEAKAVAGGVNEPAIIKSFVDAVVGPTPSTKGPAGRQDRNAAFDSRRATKAGLTPKHVTVSVGIPSSYFEEVWRQRQLQAGGQATANPDSNAFRQMDAEVSAKIRQLVLQVVPWPDDAGQDRAQFVTVTTFQNVAAPATGHQASAAHRPTWFEEHGTTASVALLALVSLLAARWIARSSATAKAHASLRVADETLDGFDDDLPGRAKAGRFRGFEGPSLREELAGIVHDDPDSAASVLRNWIGSAS